MGRLSQFYVFIFTMSQRFMLSALFGNEFQVTQTQSHTKYWKVATTNVFWKYNFIRWISRQWATTTSIKREKRDVEAIGAKRKLFLWCLRFKQFTPFSCLFPDSNTSTKKKNRRPALQWLTWLVGCWVVDKYCERKTTLMTTNRRRHTQVFFSLHRSFFLPRHWRWRRRLLAAIFRVYADTHLWMKLAIKAVDDGFDTIDDF